MDIKNLFNDASKVKGAMLYRNIIELAGDEWIHAVIVNRGKKTSTGALVSAQVVFVDDEEHESGVGRDFVIYASTASSEDVKFSAKAFNGHSDVIGEEKGLNRLFLDKKDAEAYFAMVLYNEEVA